jgi:hypothetical protein
MEPADQEQDYGAHGIFDSRATSFSPQWWASSHRGWIAAGAATAAGLLTGLMLTK